LVLTDTSNPNEAKKLKGMHTGKMKSLAGQLKAAGLSPEQQQQRTVKLPAAAPLPAAAAAMDVDHPQDEQQQQQQQQQDELQQQQLIESVVRQLGAGTPLAAADPAYVFCFVSLPGELLLLLLLYVLFDCLLLCLLASCMAR
jgi:hypothetical protein